MSPTTENTGACGIDGRWMMIALSIEHGRFYFKHLASEIAASESAGQSER